MDDDGALPQGTNTNLHRMVTNLSGQARVGELSLRNEHNLLRTF
jgi:hypothetical protein